MSKLLILAGLFVILLASCSTDRWYIDSKSIGEEGWLQTDTIIFDFKVEDTVAVNKITLDVEFDQLLFGYQNLYVHIQTIFPSLEATNQVVSLEILGDDANVTKKCSGDICSVPILLLDKFKFTTLGDHKMKITQFSRVNMLKGVRKMNMSIEKI
jgi:gliding motility-associated lipoprotein GldH